MSDHISDGDLQALIDGQLDAATHDHLMQCISNDETLRLRYEQLKAETTDLRQALSMLAPPEPPNRRRAMARFQRTQTLRRTERMFTNLSRKTQRLLAGAAVILLFAFALAFQPVRAFASDMLGLFRVESFAVVNVDSDRLEEIAAAVDENMYFGQAEFSDGAGFEPREVESLAAAEAAAGFAPLTPDADPTDVMVADSFSATFTPDLATLQTVFSALGLDPNLLPAEMDGEPFTVDVETGVAATYEIDSHTYMISQMPAPTIDVPDGVDIQELGVAMLQLLGMSEREANRLAAEIDFASTLVIPIPTEALGSVNEVEVNGNSGLMFVADEWDRYEADENFERGEGSLLMWQAGGYVYTVASDTAGSIELLAIAESLR